MTQPDLSPAMTFREASRAVLEYLQTQMELAHWMVTRTEGEDWLVLETADPERIYPVDPGDIIVWTDSFCQHVVAGDAPSITCCAQQVPLFAQSPISKKLTINAYVGVPIYDRDGELFGTLCGIDPQQQPESFEAFLPLCQLLARLLGGYLTIEMQLHAAQRRNDRQSLRPMVDAATGLFNRQGWFRLIEREASRASVLARSSHVLKITAEASATISDLAKILLGLEEEFKAEFSAGRMGPGQFQVLLPSFDARQAATRGNAIQERLRKQNVAIEWEAISVENAVEQPLEPAACEAM